MWLETCLFQVRAFLQEFARRRVDGDAGKEALEQAGRLLSVAHSKGVITNDEKAAMPREGVYAIVDWLLKSPVTLHNCITTVTTSKTFPSFWSWVGNACWKYHLEDIYQLVMVATARKYWYV